MRRGPGDPSEAYGSTLEPMAQLRPDEPPELPLARARVLGALFGDDSTVGTFGRFRVLDRIGAGGMGVVYEAYDPQLARGVALKLVTVTANARETALAEAKALARLSHPNVVPIYDVGLEHDRVYLVMELVRGETLRSWASGRAPRDILAMYLQAGVALTAAHGVGLVHRDFKPDNAIVGADGRVRVVDFGLACEADDPARERSEPRGIAGTPRFMAPEIKAGAAITPAADQYSFSVALAEALAGASAPAPRHVAAAIARGSAADPGQRFASMRDLLRALDRDPARTRRRAAAVAGLAAMVGLGAFFVGRHGASEPEICDDGAAQLDLAWHGAARRAALDRVAGLGGSDASLRPLLDRGLDAHARRWVTAYRAACRDRRRGAETEAMSDRRTTCLWRGRNTLAAVGALIEHAEPASLAELPRAVASMPDPEACSDLEALASDVAPPEPGLGPLLAEVRRQIAEADVEVGAGRYDQALAGARTAAAEARAIGYAPVLAEALVVAGHAQMNLPSRKAAVPVLTEAWHVAIASRADALAIEAWARRAYVQATMQSPEGALAGFDVIEQLAQRTASATFARALLYNNAGSAELARDDRAAARGYFRRALDESRRAAGRGALELVGIRANLGLVTDDRTEGDRWVADAVAELADRLGRDHPDTLELQRQRGFATIEDLGKAAEVLTPVCRAYEATALGDRTARCWTELGLVRWDLGDRAGAEQALGRAPAAPSQTTEVAPYLHLLRGDALAAAGGFAAAMAANPPAPTDHWWDRLVNARRQLGLGRALRQTGDLRGARGALERAVAELDAITRLHPSTSQERRLGRARVELAFVLSALGAPEAERGAVTAAAAAWLRRVGGDRAELARLEALGRGG